MTHNAYGCNAFALTPCTALTHREPLSEMAGVAKILKILRIGHDS